MQNTVAKIYKKTKDSEKENELLASLLKQTANEKESEKKQLKNKKGTFKAGRQSDNEVAESLEPTVPKRRPLRYFQKKSYQVEVRKLSELHEIEDNVKKLMNELNKGLEGDMIDVPEDMTEKELAKMAMQVEDIFIRNTLLFYF